MVYVTMMSKNQNDILRQIPAHLGVLKKPGGRKKQVQARGKTPRSQSLFFTAFALLAQLIGFFNSSHFPICVDRWELHISDSEKQIH